MIKVKFDRQIFVLQARGGISRYFAEMIKRFRARPELGIIPILDFESTSNLHMAELNAMPLHATSKGRVGRQVDLVASAYLRGAHEAYDLVHYTFYSRHHWTRGPSVSSLYDMIPEQLGIRPNPHLSKRFYLENSTRVISISETSLSEARKLYSLPLENAEVVHLGASPIFHSSQRGFAAKNSNYFLFVGERTGYKQGELAIKLLASLRDEFPNLCLVFVGTSKPTRKEFGLCRKLGVSSIVSFANLDEQSLAEVYKNAAFLFFPSRIEGFGFPPIEAMLSYTPVLGLRNKINEEISGSHMSYFSDSDVLEDIRSHAAKILKGTSHPEKSLRQAAKNAQRFNWDSVVERTADVYRKTLQDRGVA